MGGVCAYRRRKIKWIMQEVERSVPNAVDMYISLQGLMDQSCPARTNMNQQVCRNKVVGLDLGYGLTGNFLCCFRLKLVVFYSF